MKDDAPNRIRLLRDEALLSIRDLAAKTGLDSNTIHRLETGAIRLDVERMRRIASALGLKASALLNDDDMELRVGADGRALLSEFAEVPPDDRPEILHATREIVRIARAMAARASLSGDAGQVGALAGMWNEMSGDQRQRALALLDNAREFARD